jgi:hypothetical protein
LSAPNNKRIRKKERVKPFLSTSKTETSSKEEAAEEGAHAEWKKVVKE